MSDYDAIPGPTDKAYVEAEAVLDDESARTARRARVLAAVASEQATASASSSHPVRRDAWRGGGWLVAASVAGMSALLTIQIYAPSPVRERPSPPVQAVASEAAPDAAASPSTRAPAEALGTEARPKAVAPRTPAFSSVTSAAPPPLPVPPAVAPPMLAPPAEPPPAPPAAPPPAASPLAVTVNPGGLSEVVVTAQKRARSLESSSRRRLEPEANADFVAPQAPAARGVLKPLAGAPSDGVARLLAAASAGRTVDLATLLAKGVPVDAPDADGETALMKSIQAGYPAAAALLHRHGASLDRRNAAGDSARDMAMAIDDTELNRALGLDQ